jgi:DNA-binding helix-hairpin-helix protein with protein kinase domain
VAGDERSPEAKILAPFPRFMPDRGAYEFTYPQQLFTHSTSSIQIALLAQPRLVVISEAEN